jgi:cell wall-associated NlpC family hydrolase
MNLHHDLKHVVARPLNMKWLGIFGAITLVLLASCTSAPRYRSGPSDIPGDGDRQAIVQYARSFLGTPYRYGGTTRSGVDCSGLVTAVYREFNISLPRSSKDQSRVGKRVDRSSLAPADLVFFKTSGSGTISHVGIYIGNGQFIHASTGAKKVRIDHMNDDYFKRRFRTARRVVSG